VARLSPAETEALSGPKGWLELAAPTLRGRRDVREKLDLAPDATDEPAPAPPTDEDLAGLFGRTPRPVPRHIRVLYFTRTERDEAHRRWPATYTPDDAYFAQAELHWRALAEEGMTPIRLFAGTAEGLARFAEANRLDPEQESTRTRYLGALPEDASIAWPPGRNAPCWCASGRKYKKCCGAVRRPAGPEHRTARCADRSARRTRRPGSRRADRPPRGAPTGPVPHRQNGRGTGMTRVGTGPSVQDGMLPPMKSRVLVVDDDPALAEMLTIVLRGEGFDTAVVGDGTRALPAVREMRPDVVLLDLMLPGMNGIDVCRAIRAESGVPIVMLTAKSDTVDIVLGLESGADDYVVKPFKPKELVARIRARVRRTEAEPAEQLTIGDVEIDVPAHQVTRKGERIALTPLEFDLLVALARKPRQVFTREVLLEQVWGYRHAADTRLVNVHVQRLRSKVEKDPEHPEVVLTVRGVGYKAGPP
jgi:two-component system response regulator MtrA